MITDDMVAKWNAEIREALSTALSKRGYLVVGIGGGRAVHAARTAFTDNRGYLHPRAFCQKASPLHYAGVASQDATVDCQRCLASMAKQTVR